MDICYPSNLVLAVQKFLPLKNAHSYSDLSPMNINVIYKLAKNATIIEGNITIEARHEIQQTFSLAMHSLCH